MTKGVFLFGFASLLQCSFAIAQDQDGSKCTQIASDSHRLGCFDEVFKKTDADKPSNITKASRLTNTTTTGLWEIGESRSEMTDSKGYFAFVHSESPYISRFGESKPVKLELRCLEGVTSAYFVLKGVFVTDHQSWGEVRFRLDESPAFKRRLTASTDHNALGLWTGKAAISFIKTITSGNTLRVEITPFNESRSLFEFKLDGIYRVATHISGTCGWKL